MKTLSITNGNVEFQITVDQIKYLLGSNNETKHRIKQIIKLYYNSVLSDYREDNDYYSKVSIEGDLLNLKRTSLVEIRDSYSFVEEGKLGTKSLLTKYFELKLQSTEYYETIETIDILFNTLTDELNEDDLMKVEFNPINPKILLKLMKAYFDDSYQKDEYDLSIEEIIIQQIRILKYIQENEYKIEKYIVILESKSLTKNIIHELQSLKRTIILVFSDYYLDGMELKDIFICEDIQLDFGDFNTIYEQFGEHQGQILTCQEVINKMELYVKAKYEKQKVHLINDINKFSL